MLTPPHKNARIFFAVKLQKLPGREIKDGCLGNATGLGEEI